LRSVSTEHDNAGVSLNADGLIAPENCPKNLESGRPENRPMFICAQRRDRLRVDDYPIGYALRMVIVHALTLREIMIAQNFPICEPQYANT
jgi:hypothetical protein